MKMPRPTKNAEQGTAGQGAAIVPDTASASKTPGCAIGTTMLALVDALNTAVLRAWCASPSAWSRGTIRAKAKAPVTEKHQIRSGCSPHRKAGFCHAQIPGAGAPALPHMVSGGMAAAVTPGARLRACFSHPAHPLR